MESLDNDLRRLVGRNDPCPCGSGKKYKNCCGQLQPALGPRPSQGELQALLAMMHAGRWVELESTARALLEASPQSGPLWQLLGLALSKQDKDALQALTEAVKLLPGDATAHVNLGNALGRSGRPRDAEASYRQALAIRPDFVEAWLNLGNVLLDLDQLAQAAETFQHAIRLRPTLAEAHLHLGKTLLRAGDYQLALESCERAAQLAPESAESHNNLGNAHSRLGRFVAAIASFQRALSLQPDFAEAHANLGNALRGLNRLEEALASYRAALRVKPDFVCAHVELATTLRLQRLSAESEAVCHEALLIAPDSAAVFAVLAELRADTGRFAEAEEYFRRAVAIDPDAVEAWAGLSRVRRMSRADVEWLQAAQKLLQRGLQPQREMTLRYALGKYYDDVRDYPAAFNQYQRANELAKQCSPPHDREQTRRSIDLIIRSHDATWLKRSAVRTGDPGPLRRPVFIIGMLRSGTSLAEQILASHPLVFGAGELTYWSTALASLLAGGERSLALDDAGLARLASGYLEQMQRMAPQATCVLDKLPTNFLAVGLIKAAVPGARFIHMRRDPVDTCLSIYFQQFEAANTYTHDLGDLADYYQQYEKLMQHWGAVLPDDAFLDVPYEQLVADTGKWARAMVQFIDLPWDPRCLEFNRTARTVVTASKWQVRQGIDASSVARWRHYEGFLGPLKSLVASSPR